MLTFEPERAHICLVTQRQRAMMIGTHHGLTAPSAMNLQVGPTPVSDCQREREHPGMGRCLESLTRKR